MSLTVPVAEIVETSNDPLLAKHETWERVSVGEVAEILNGAAFKSSLFTKDGGWPLIRIRDVGKTSTDCFYDGPFEDRYIVEPGDLVVGMDGEFRARRWLGPRALLNQRVCKISLKTDLCIPGFLDITLPGYLDAIREQTSSVTVTHLSSRDISEIPLPLPPLAEQRRIVAKVEELLARVNAARERLAKASTILKRFRQSVLAAACSGQLTADWREANADIESGHEALTHVAELRDAAVAPTSVSRPAELPDTWAWTTFGFVLGELRNGISTRPSVEPPGAPILRISAARPGRVILDDVRYLPDSKGLIEVYSLKDRDLLFTRYNGSIELLGICGMVRGLGRTSLLYPDKLMRARFDHAYVLPEFVEVFFQGPEARERLMGEAKSSAGQQGVSGKDIKMQAIAIPPVEEQVEIGRRVQSFFALADKIESRVLAAAGRVEKITRAILAKAFRGELVSTEAELSRQEGRDYEPASELLNRIRAARAIATGDVPKRHKSAASNGKSSSVKLPKKVAKAGKGR